MVINLGVPAQKSSSTFQFYVRYFVSQSEVRYPFQSILSCEDAPQLSPECALGIRKVRTIQSYFGQKILLRLFTNLFCTSASLITGARI